MKPTTPRAAGVLGVVLGVLLLLTPLSGGGAAMAAGPAAQAQDEQPVERPREAGKARDREEWRGCDYERSRTSARRYRDDGQRARAGGGA